MNRANPSVPRLSSLAFCLASGAIMGGCQQTRNEPPAGMSAHRFVEAAEQTAKNAAPVSPSEQQAPLVALEPARPLEPLTQPLYPAAARGRQTVPMSVGVRLLADEVGRVAAVRSSPLALSTPGALAGEFQAAVETAVRQWRFEPAERRRMTPKTGPGGAYWHVTRLEVCPYEVDVLFTFTASGEVTSVRR